MEAARRAGTVVSYDLNYRPSIWNANGGPPQAHEVNRTLLPLVDVLFGNEEDFTAALGYPVDGLDLNHQQLDPANFKRMIATVIRDFPNLSVIGTTLRVAKTASVNDWGAICYCNGDFYEAKRRTDLQVYDRVGGGDFFASGLIYGFLPARTRNGRSTAEPPMERLP